jgi:hypothetical protein
MTAAIDVSMDMLDDWRQADSSVTIVVCFA